VIDISFLFFLNKIKNRNINDYFFLTKILFFEADPKKILLALNKRE